MSIDATLTELTERISNPDFPPAKINGEISNGLDDLILNVAPKWREITQISSPLRPIAMEAILREAARSEERGDHIRAIHGYKQIFIASMLRVERLLMSSCQSRLPSQDDTFHYIEILSTALEEAIPTGFSEPQVRVIRDMITVLKSHEYRLLEIGKG